MINGVIQTNTPDGMRNDYLFRVSLKAYIENNKGQVLVVKETGRTWWDLPGGGVDHGESIKEALIRELREEVGYEGNVKYRTLAVDDPHILEGVNAYQVRLILQVIPENTIFTIGEEADDIKFIDPAKFSSATHPVEHRIWAYYQLVKYVC